MVLGDWLSSLVRSPSWQTRCVAPVKKKEKKDTNEILQRQSLDLMTKSESFRHDFWLVRVYVSEYH